MPEISRFYGIVIKMFFDDHNPPHFHALYGEYKVLIDINTSAVLCVGAHQLYRALNAGVDMTSIVKC